MKSRVLTLVMLFPMTSLWAQTSTVPASGPAPDAAVVKMMAELFAKDDPAAAVEAQRAVVDAAGGDFGKLKAAIAADTAYPKCEAGWATKNSQVVGRGGKKYDLQYYVRTPEGYDLRKSYPLLLVHHGQGGNGQEMGRWAEAYLGPHADEFIIVAPTQPVTQAFYDASPQTEQGSLTSLAEVRRRMNVDDDRVYISGYSQGGHQTWHLATMFPHLWAAAIPMAGVPWFESSPYSTRLYMGNSAAVPIWAIWGELDHKDPKHPGNVTLCREAQKWYKDLKIDTFKGTELAGVGHGGNEPAVAEYLKFFGKYRRALPRQFEFVFHMPHHARAYWLEATAFTAKPMDLSEPVRATVSTKDPAEAEEAIRTVLRRRLFHLSGKCDRDTNTVTVKGTGLRTVRFYVIDGMLDLSKPVTINYFNRTWKGKIAPSPQCMLQHYAATRDQTQLIVNEVELDSGGKAVVKYP